MRSHLVNYEGDLHLDADSNDPLELTALSRLESTGDLYVNVDSLRGLESLRVVYGDFHAIGDCTPLRRLSWVGGNFRTSLTTDEACFEQLAAVGGTLVVGSHTPVAERFPSLGQVDELRLDTTQWTEMSAFPRLQRARRVVVRGDGHLTRLDGFPSLEQLSEIVIGEESDTSTLLHNFDLTHVTLPPIDSLVVRIARSYALASISVPAGVSHLERLELVELEALERLDGLSSLQSIGTLEVSGVGPTDLVGLSNVRALSELRVADTTSLASLSGLDALVSLGLLTISNAATLDACSASDLASRLGMTCDGCPADPTCQCLDPAGIIRCTGN